MDRLVFVYGTLLGGESNHHLLSHAERLGEHRTAPCFSLYDLGAYPGLTRNGSTAILGEVYRTNAAGLRQLDRLEDYPRLYTRIQILSPWGPAWSYCYRGRIRDRPLIRSGDWRSRPTPGRTCGAAPLRRPRARATGSGG